MVPARIQDALSLSAFSVQNYNAQIQIACKNDPDHVRDQKCRRRGIPFVKGLNTADNKK